MIRDTLKQLQDRRCAARNAGDNLAADAFDLAIGVALGRSNVYAETSNLIRAIEAEKEAKLWEARWDAQDRLADRIELEAAEREASDEAALIAASERNHAIQAQGRKS